MSEHQRFHIKTLDQLREESRGMQLDIPVEEDIRVLLEPVSVGGRQMPNRFTVQPMEGFDAGPDGAPGDLTFRRYGRYARGGFGLIWMEATAVLEEGRSNPGQLYLHAGNAGVFKKLIESARQVAREQFGHEILVVIQLTHSGRYSKPHGVPKPIIAHHSPILDPKHNLPEDYPLVTDDYLDRLQDSYVSAARLAAEAGVDGIDVKSCHRYLVSELHASFTREGKYGGSFENRTRLLRETLARVRAEVPSVFITTRMSAYDAISYPYGFGVNRDDYRIPDLEEPIRLVGELKNLQAPVLNISIGNPYYNPHFGRPFDFPIQGAAVPGEHPMAGLNRFIHITGELQKAFPNLPVIGSGYSWLRQFMPYVAAGVIRRGGATLVGIGRGAFAYPDTVRDLMQTGSMTPEKCCVTCSACTQIMRDGGMTGCVVRDREIYGPQYRLGRRFAMDRLREEARKCRDCETATCTAGCPAHVDVPGFIRAFAEDDVRGAYAILRQSNVLPEMCAYVCPSEVQCEGGCLENIFCRKPIPIRDIQLVICRMARQQGWTGVALSAKETGRRPAVVGGGPAGISAVIRLLEKGHHVTLYEKGTQLGGTPDQIIPEERYTTAREEVESILKPAIQSGRLEIRTGCELGRNLELGGLRDRHEAVLLAMGLDQSSSLGAAPGVVDALQFLGDVKRGSVQSVPDQVAVLGGGNTAMDAAVTARNLGARDVYLVYRRSFEEMPAWPAEREKFMAAGGHCLILTQPVGYETGKDGKLTGLKIARTELGVPDDSGRRRPSVIPNSENVLKVGLVIEALGQGVSERIRTALPGLNFTHSGFVKTVSPEEFSTGVEGIYAAGDLINGGTTAVQGVAEGCRAALEMDAFLSGCGTKKGG